jgi:hypothetical protein
MIPPYHSWAYIQRSVNQYLGKIPAYSCLLKNQLRCPKTDEWIKKKIYIYHEILLSHKEK